MKKTKWLASLFAFVIVSVMCVQFAQENAQKKYVQVSKGFSLPVNNYILMMKEYDIDSDGKEDEIYVYGEKKNEETEYAEKINLAVVYKRNGFVKKTNVSWLKGFVSDVEVADFTKNKNKDIFLKVYTDQNKSVLSGLIVDFGHEIPKTIFNKFSGISPTFLFADGFLISCKLSDGQEFAVNLSAKKDALIKNGVFDSAGKRLVNPKVYSKPFSDLKATDTDGDGVYELSGSQSVVLSSDETELFKIYSTQKYKNNSWFVTKIEVRY